MGIFKKEKSNVGIYELLGGNIMLERIDNLKRYLNELMSKEEKDYKKILEVSQELDVLIVEYYRELGIEKV